MTGSSEATGPTTPSPLSEPSRSAGPFLFLLMFVSGVQAFVYGSVGFRGQVSELGVLDFPLGFWF